MLIRPARTAAARRPSGRSSALPGPRPGRPLRPAAELAEDLDRWRTGLSLRHARQPRMRPGMARWTRRRRSAAFVAASSLALALAASALTLRVSGEGRRELALAKYLRDPRPRRGPCDPHLEPAAPLRLLACPRLGGRPA